jgi:hypothetical protein
MKLDHVVHAEAQRLKGDEMVMPVSVLIRLSMQEPMRTEGLPR